ncbi:Lachrymatory-factor synthase [Linum grandiflorum]
MQAKRWEGKATAELKSPITADQVWPFFDRDFCSFHNWSPTIDTCHQVEGVVGQPGLVRYCASKAMWCKERLLAIDPTDRCLSYEILDNNIGFGSYVSTIRVVDQHQPPGCCRIEWSFVAEPVSGWTLEGLNSYVSSSLDYMASKIQEVVLSSPLVHEINGDQLVV